MGENLIIYFFFLNLSKKRQDSGIRTVVAAIIQTNQWFVGEYKYICQHTTKA